MEDSELDLLSSELVWCLAVVKAVMNIGIS
jgi:hypothetical protein